MRKEEIGIDAAGNAFVLRKLLSVVGRQRMHPVRKRRQQGDDGIGNGLGSFTLYLANQCIARFALVERNQRLLLAGADDQVAFPIAKTQARVDDGGTLLDGNLVGNSSASLAATVALLSQLLTAQVCMQGATDIRRVLRG